MADELKLDSWHYRRRVVFATLAYCGAANAILLFRGTDGALHTVMAQGNIYLAGFMGLVYVAGALADDIVRAKLGMAPRNNPPKEG